MLYGITFDDLVGELSLPILRDLAPVQADDAESTDYYSAGVSELTVELIGERVDGEIHGYTRGVYDVPFADPVDLLIVQTKLELMHYQFYKRRDAANIPDRIIDLYKVAIKRLQSIQKREITLTSTMATPDDDQPSSYPYISPPAKFPAGFTGM